MMKTEQEQIKAMTKDEIKKAFAICCGVQDCTGCPILDMEKQNGLGCKFNLFTRVIDTVSEQEKEIERLKAEFQQLETNAEILARGVRDLNHENYELTEKIKQAQIDLLNEVKKCSQCDNFFPDGNWHRYVLVSDIDILIKEIEEQ